MASLGGGIGMDLSEQKIMSRGLNKDLEGEHSRQRGQHVQRS